MAGETKFTEEEVKSLKELQESYMEVQSQLGRLSIAKLNFQKQAQELEQRDAETREQFFQLQTKEQELVQELTKKYGQGSLDPSTGVFTPIDDSKK